MNQTDRVFVAGHRGLAGSAIVRRLAARGFANLLLRSRAELELTDEAAVEAFFQRERPDHVVLAAAKVGGILANNTYRADFIRENLAIQSNVINAAWRSGVKKLVFLGSSCIYPRDCAQPIREEFLLTGPLEMTNRPYAIAKIAGIEMCWSYNWQYGTRFVAAMPTNLYGPGDNYDLEKSHVLPALIRRMHEAKQLGAGEVILWGTGTPRREFLHSEDMADAIIHVLSLDDDRFAELCGSRTHPPLLNVGCGEDQTIRELAEMVRETVGYEGRLTWDTSKPDGTPRKLLDVGQLRALGWRPAIPLRQGISMAYQDFCTNLSRYTC
jgi:GDP-L-fucose synthase